MVRQTMNEGHRQAQTLEQSARQKACHQSVSRRVSGQEATRKLTTRKRYAWTSKTVYNTLPLNAGFFVAPEALGANVVAAFLANLDT